MNSDTPLPLLRVAFVRCAFGIVVMLGLGTSIVCRADAVPPHASPPARSNLRITPISDPDVVGVRRATPTSSVPNANPKELSEEFGDAVWRTDYAAALRQAAGQKKLVLLNFTGSDWCGWCHRLEADVFSKPEFKTYAARHLVLVTVDFPKKKRQPPAEAAQNARLQQQFGVRGFPSLIAVDGDGRKVAELRGYVRGGPRAFIAALEKQARP